MGQARAPAGGFPGGGQQIQHLELLRQVTGQGGNLLGYLSRHAVVAALLGELQLAQKAGKLGQLVPFAHQAEQHLVDRIGIILGLRDGLLGWTRGKYLRGRGAGQALPVVEVGAQIGVGLDGVGNALHHAGQVKGEHAGGEYQVVSPQVAQPLQLPVATDLFRYRRHGKGGKIVQRQVAQVRRQEWRHVFAEVGLHRQHHDVAGVELVRLRVHAEVDQGMAPGTLGIPAFECQIHQ